MGIVYFDDFFIYTAKKRASCNKSVDILDQQADIRIADDKVVNRLVASWLSKLVIHRLAASCFNKL